MNNCMGDSPPSHCSLLTPLLSPPAPPSSPSSLDRKYNARSSSSSSSSSSIDKVYNSTHVNLHPSVLSSKSTSIHKRNSHPTMSSLNFTPPHSSSTEDELPSSSSSTTSHQHQRSNHRNYKMQDILHSLHRQITFHRRNLTLSELSGSLGDLGTFIPLTVALARERKITLAPALFWAGMCNLITGCLWDVPMCVQPMKAIAAVALTTDTDNGGSSFDAASVTAAGILSGACVLLLGVTNLMEVVNWLIPLTVVCGLQMGVGLRLASSGITDIQKLTWVGGYDCIVLGIGCAVLSAFWLRDTEHGTKKKKKQREEAEGSGGLGQRAMMPVDDSATNTGTIDLSNEMNSSGTDDSEAEADNGRMEMGTMQHQPESSTTEPSPADSTLSRSSKHPSMSSLSCFKLILKRACCCLNPAPKTPHPVGVYLFLIGCLFAAITLATATADSGYDLPLHFFGAPVVINAVKDITSFNWQQGFLQGTFPQLPLTTLNR